MDGNTAYKIRLDKTDKLIQEKNTGDYYELGKKLGCCERTAENFINELKHQLKPFNVYIVFDEDYNSFVYTKPGRCADLFLWIPPEMEEILKSIFLPPK